MEYLQSPLVARQLGHGVSRGYRHDARLSMPERAHLRLGGMVPQVLGSPQVVGSHRGWEPHRQLEVSPPPSEREYSPPVTPPASRTQSRMPMASAPVPWALQPRSPSPPGFAGLPTSAADHFETGHMRPTVGYRISSASASNEGGSPGGRSTLTPFRIVEGGVYVNESAWTAMPRGRARPRSTSSGPLELFAA